jgi:hypothetical protein
MFMESVINSILNACLAQKHACTAFVAGAAGDDLAAAVDFWVSVVAHPWFVGTCAAARAARGFSQAPTFSA